MRQTIATRYLGYTATKPARISAKPSGGAPGVIINWDSGLDIGENHIRAAKALRDRLGWGGEWVGGGTPDGFVFVDVSAALKVWPCGTKEGAAFGVLKGWGFGEGEPLERDTDEPPGAPVWIVAGTDRALHALGLMEPFEERVRADDAEEAKRLVRDRRNPTREHILITRCTLEA